MRCAWPALILAIPIPINLSFSLPAMPSSGTIYQLPAACGNLTLQDLKGPALLFDSSTDAGAGRTVSVLFIGGSVAFAGAAAIALSALSYIPALLASSNACVSFGRMGASVLPFNVSGSLYLGMIS